MSNSSEHRPPSEGENPEKGFILDDARDAALRKSRDSAYANFRLGTIAKFDSLPVSGLQDHYRHKRQWSHIVALYLLAMLVFQCVPIRNVGLGHWNFEKYDWLLPVLLVQNLGQIVSLAYIVVKSLFRDM